MANSYRNYSTVKIHCMTIYKSFLTNKKTYLSINLDRSKYPYKSLYAHYNTFEFRLTQISQHLAMLTTRLPIFCCTKLELYIIKTFPFLNF